MDEWVTEDRLNKEKLQLPKKEDTKKTNKGSGYATSTPGNGSRPSSPERELVNGTARPKAMFGRKRKANAMDKSSDEVMTITIPATGVLLRFGAGVHLDLAPGQNLC